MSKPQFVTIALVTVVSLIGIPYAINSMAADSQAAQNRKRIAEMSPTESELLNANFKSYKSLESRNPKRLTELETIHQQLSQNPELLKTAEQYREWLTSLESWQREKIREMPNDAEKFEYVSNLLDPSVVRIPADNQLATRFPDGIEVPVADVAAMAKHLRAGIAEKKITDEAVLRVKLNYFMWSRGGANPEPAKGADQIYSLLKSTAELISVPTLKEYLATDTRRSRQIVIMLLQEFERRNAKNVKDDEHVQTVFVGLSEKKQDEIMQMDPEMAISELRNIGRATRAEDSVYNRLIFSARMRQPGGGGPRGRDGGRREGEYQGGGRPGKGPDGAGNRPDRQERPDGGGKGRKAGGPNQRAKGGK